MYENTILIESRMNSWLKSYIPTVQELLLERIKAEYCFNKLCKELIAEK